MGVHTELAAVLRDSRSALEAEADTTQGSFAEPEPVWALNHTLLVRLGLQNGLWQKLAGCRRQVDCDPSFLDF